MTILQKQRVDITTVGPTVVLQIGHHQAHLAYRVAFRVAQHMRLQARQVQQTIRDNQRHWTEVGNYLEEPPTPIPTKRSLKDWLSLLRAPHPPIPTPPSNKKIGVMRNGEEVVLRLGNTEIGFHYTDATVVSQYLRARAKEAKAFAGDKSREMSIVGILTDASK